MSVGRYDGAAINAAWDNAWPAVPDVRQVDPTDLRHEWSPVLAAPVANLLPDAVLEADSPGGNYGITIDVTLLDVPRGKVYAVPGVTAADARGDVLVRWHIGYETEDGEPFIGLDVPEHLPITASPETVAAAVRTFHAGVLTTYAQALEESR